MREFQSAVLSKVDGPYGKGRTITTAPPRTKLLKGGTVSADTASPKGPLHVDPRRFAAWAAADFYEPGSARPVWVDGEEEVPAPPAPAPDEPDARNGGSPPAAPPISDPPGGDPGVKPAEGEEGRSDA